MSKKSIRRKAVNRIIHDMLNQGFLKEEILNTLSEQYFDRNTLSKLIAVIPYPEKRNKYNILNNILLSLLIVTVIVKLLIGFTIFNYISFWLTPLAFLLPVFNIYFAYGVYHYRGDIYFLVGGFSILSIFNGFPNIATFDIMGLIELLIVLIIVVLAFYLRYKLFPNYNLFGPQKNINGESILD